MRAWQNLFESKVRYFENSRYFEKKIGRSRTSLNKDSQCLVKSNKFELSRTMSKKSRTNLFKVKLCPVKSNNVRYNRTKSSNVAYRESKHKGKLTETKFKTLNRLKKKQTSCSSSSKTKKKRFFDTNLKLFRKKTSSTGNRTPVSNVTDWDTNHYTTEDTIHRIASNFTSFEILKL